MPLFLLVLLVLAVLSALFCRLGRTFAPGVGVVTAGGRPGRPVLTVDGLLLALDFSAGLAWATGLAMASTAGREVHHEAKTAVRSQNGYEQT